MKRIERALGPLLRKLRDDLIDRQTLPRAAVALHQAIVVRRRHVATRENQLGGFARSPQRRYPQVFDGFAREQLAVAPRVFAALLGQRRIHPSLQAPLTVPLGLAVPHEVQDIHVSTRDCYGEDDIQVGA